MGKIIEYYFVQLMFCKNRELLYKESRELYDVLFDKYKDVFSKGRQAHIDLEIINREFLKSI